MHYSILGNPQSRRVKLFQEALARAGCKPPGIISWESVLSQRIEWSKAFGPETHLRIESPGQNFQVYRMLLAKGADEEDKDAPHAERIKQNDAINLKEDKGRLRYVRQWYLGFRRALAQLKEGLQECPPYTCSHSVEDISLLFDKVACQRAFATSGLPIPRMLGAISSYEELLSIMKGGGIRRVFIKLAHGSSAAGVVAFEHNDREQKATTTVEMVASPGCVKLYNSRKISVYRQTKQIESLINRLARERVQVEAWIPKARLGGKAFDLRVVVIGGKACHRVLRLSTHPMTNLHLLNERKALNAVENEFGTYRLNALTEDCEKAMKLFPTCLHGGMDVLISSAFKKHYILEGNAFGDLLPGITCRGQVTYDQEIAQIQNGWGLAKTP